MQLRQRIYFTTKDSWSSEQTPALCEQISQISGRKVLSKDEEIEAERQRLLSLETKKIDGSVGVINEEEMTEISEDFVEKMAGKELVHINKDNPLEIAPDWGEKDAAYFNTDALGKTEYHKKPLKFWEDLVEKDSSGKMDHDCH